MEKVAKTQQKGALELKDSISTNNLNSTSALCSKRVLTILGNPLIAACVRAVPRSDTALTSAPLARRNFTISGYPEEKNKKVNYY